MGCEKMPEFQLMTSEISADGHSLLIRISSGVGDFRSEPIGSIPFPGTETSVIVIFSHR